MSLATDSIFVAALKSNADLVGLLGGSASEGKPGRIYGTTIPLPDEELVNTPVPYVLVTFDGLNNDIESKDSAYESGYDHVNIGIEVVARTLKDLHELTQLVRSTILGYFRGNNTDVEDYQLTADGIMYDQLKPCYWQVLRYLCDVRLFDTEDDGQEED